MLEIEFECKSVRRASERWDKGGSRVHAVCNPADGSASSPRCGGDVLHGAAGGIVGAHARHNQPFAQLYLSAEMPGPLAGSA
jgi:hypothetical protein